MSTVTPRLGLLKAAYTDPVDVVADIDAAYDTLDTAASMQPAVAFPGSPYTGKTVQRTDLGDKPYYYQATAGRFANIPFDTFFAKKTADQIINNSIAMTNDTELFVANLVVNGVYLVKGYIIYSSPTVTPDLNMTFTLPAGGAFINWTTSGLEKTSTTDSGNIRFPNTPVGVTRSAATIAATDMVVPVQGCVVMGSIAGTLQYQWAQVVATAENTVVRANSWLYLQRVA
jgi:hypothetical protein